jgi:hypothetical protein
MKVSSKLRMSCFAALAMAAAHAGVFSPVGALPGSGSGLNGQFWKVGPGLGTILDNDTAVAGVAPADTFTVSEIFTNNVGDGISLSGFLDSVGVFATNFAGADPIATNVNESYFIFSGFLAVPTAGTWNFQTSSDDASNLSINGTMVVNNDNPHGQQPATGLATFSGAGVYGFAVKFAENGGGVVIQVSADKTGGNSFTALGGSDFALSSASVPEPTTFGLMGAGLAIALMRLRRRCTA